MTIAGAQETVTVTAESAGVDPGTDGSLVGRRDRSKSRACRSTAATSSASPSSRLASRRTARRCRALSRPAACHLPVSAPAPTTSWSTAWTTTTSASARCGADLQPGGDPGISGAHQLVFGGVRQGVGGRREHRDEERHQHGARQRLRVLPGRDAQCQRPFREVRPIRQSDRTREGAVQPAAMGRGARRSDQEGQDVLLPVVRDGRMSRPAISSPSIRGVAELLAANGFPVELGNVPYAARGDRGAGKIDHQFSPPARWWSAPTSRTPPTRTSSRSAASSRAAAERCSSARTGRFRPLTRHVGSSTLGERGALPVCAAGRAGSLPRSRAVADGARMPSREVRRSSCRAWPASAASDSRRSVRKNDRYQFMETLSILSQGPFNQGRRGAQLHEQRPSSSCRCTSAAASSSRRCPPIRRSDCPSRFQPCRRSTLGTAGGVRAGLRQSAVCVRLQRPVGVRAGRMEDRRPELTIKPGIRYQKQFWPRGAIRRLERRAAAASSTAGREDGNNVAPRLAVAIDPTGAGRTSIHAAYGHYYDHHITGNVAGGQIVNGSTGVRTFAARFPPRSRHGTRPVIAFLSQSTAFPSVEIAIDPALETPYRAARLGRRRSRARPRHLPFPSISCRCAADTSSARLTTTRSCPSLGPGRRPNDVDNRAGTSASILQYTSFGETWYKGLTLSLNKRFGHNVSVPRRLHAFESRRHFHGLSERVHARGQRAGAESRGSDRPAARLRSRPRAGSGKPGSAPPVRAVRSVSISVRHSAVRSRDGRVGPAVHRAGRSRPQRRWRRRRVSTRPGATQSSRSRNERGPAR